MRNRSFFGGSIQSYPVAGGSQGQGELPSQLVSQQYVEDESKPAGNRFGSLLTYEKPIVEFGPDINLVASTITRLTAGELLPGNCVGCRFINLVGTVTGSFNGGPFRTILNNDTLQGVEIRTMTIQTAALSSVTVQAVGTGD